jgi:hypothetical protein
MVDGDDWLGPRYLGLDPPHFRTQVTPTAAGWTLVGRCDCGCVGCGDVFVTIERHEQHVTWTTPLTDVAGHASLTFNARQYDAELERFANDHSWEDLERRVERHVDSIFAGTKTADGFAFNWASARHGPLKTTISLSFDNGRSDMGYQQQFLEFGWDGKTLDDAMSAAHRFKRQHFG